MADKLTTTRAILTPSSDLVQKAVSDGFYQELDQEFGQGFAGHTLVSEFAFDSDWGVWEIHPMGDELVYLIEGETDFVLASDDGEKTIHLAQSGEYVVVPRNTWHTARTNKATRCLFITPGEGTMNALTPGGEPM